MFKLFYFAKIKNINNKTLKYTPLTNLTLLNSILVDYTKLNLIKKNKSIKTIVLSPFHYKTSKRNIVNSTCNYCIEMPESSLLKSDKALIYSLVKTSIIGRKLVESLNITHTKLIINC